MTAHMKAVASCDEGKVLHESPVDDYVEICAPMCAMRLERPRQPVLERPHPARRTQVMSPARHARRVGQSDNMLLGPLRAVDDRDQNARRADCRGETHRPAAR